MSNTPFWLGGVAASMAACITHPLDLTKVRMQTIEPTPTPGLPRPSIVSVIRTTVAESGIRSLYTGLTASVTRQMTYSLVRLGSYEEIKRRIAKDRPPTTGELLIAASIAGALGGIAGNPADILLIRMTSDTARPPDKRYGYSNVFNGFIRLVEAEGFRGLTRGIGINTGRAILMNSSQVGSYDYFKATLLQRPLPIINYQLRDNLLLHITASCLAGTVATTICSPADVIRSRLMSSAGKTSPMDVLRKSLQDEGPKFMFKGWTPAFIRLTPNTVLLFIFFEQLKKLRTAFVDPSSSR